MAGTQNQPTDSSVEPKKEETKAPVQPVPEQTSK
jgi:hypothetical protein